MVSGIVMRYCALSNTGVLIFLLTMMLTDVKAVCDVTPVLVALTLNYKEIEIFKRIQTRATSRLTVTDVQAHRTVLISYSKYHQGPHPVASEFSSV